MPRSLLIHPFFFPNKKMPLDRFELCWTVPLSFLLIPLKHILLSEKQNRTELSRAFFAILILLLDFLLARLRINRSEKLLKKIID